MKYKYLVEFARTQKVSGLFYRNVLRWRDQYALIFSGQRYLQINLQQQDPFCFFTDRDLIDWTQAAELAIMQQHLKRARLENITIAPQERIIYLDFSQPDPFQKRLEYRLILELIPQFGNIILTRKEENGLVIVDCAKKVSLAENRQRQILPAVLYEPPPKGYMNEAMPLKYPLGFQDDLKPAEALTDGYNDINAFLEALYYQGWLQKLSDQHQRNQIKRISQTIKKKQRKIAKLNEELSQASREDKWLQMGELLKASQNLIKPGTSSISLINYYDPQLKEIQIKLNKEKPPKWNIDQYFKKYRKARTGRKLIARQIEITEKELTELHQKQQNLKEMSLVLPGQIELTVTGKNSLADSISRLPVSADWVFLIGKNSSQNDLITTRIARPQDWWFHTRIFRGTHIVLRNLGKKILPPELKELGCRLAAYYSKAGKSQNVPVDYTQIRYVHKPRGSAPGFVIYTHQKTLYVNPLSQRDAGKEIEKWKL